ncbi:ATP-binding cassette domain-containing protein [Patulibacter sp. NPDC049589]|uniref:ATP-binding cassette domain-containing protein n=1 Tax=Patulibacter sp. NPDC049589 TaxID=3154731 RepID=UPI00343BEA28
MPSILLDARAVARHHGPRTVLLDVDVRVHTTSRIGLIGPNGSGKTTLLRVLAGVEPPDAGAVRHHGAVGHLPQLAGHDDPRPARAVALDRLGVTATARRVDALAERLAAGDLAVIDAHAAALERWLTLGGDDAEARLAAAAADVGLEDGLLDRPLGRLSGGQAARVGLAILRTSRHDVVLLDEPTNHLDEDGLAVLRRVIREHRGGLVLVSHDRALLTDVADELVVLGDPDAPAGTALHHRGGFASWEHERAEARRRAAAEHEEAVTARAALRSAADETRRRADASRRKAGATTHDNDKHAKEWVRSRAEGMQRRARVVEGRAARPLPEKPREPARLRLALTAAEQRTPWAVALDGAVLERGTFRIGPVDLEVAHGERLLLSGRNGSGKSTLLAGLAGTLAPVAGSRLVAPGAVVATLGQARRALLGDDPVLTALDPDATAAVAVAAGRPSGASAPRPGATPVDGHATAERPSVAAAVAALAGADVTDARTALATFGLPAEVVLRPARSLSPGELTRAELAILALRRTTCLLLDEPTNHLDLASLEALEEALRGWPGALVVASHDARFREALGVTRTLAL